MLPLDRVVPLLEPISDKSVEAAYTLGRIYWDSTKSTSEPNYDTPRHWFERATVIDPSYSPAHFALGYTDHTRWLSEQDNSSLRASAMKHYQDGSKRGSGFSVNNLGTLYEYLEWTTKAFESYYKAAKKDCVSGKFNVVRFLGRPGNEKKFVITNKELAEFLGSAARKGFEPARRAAEYAKARYSARIQGSLSFLVQSIY